MTQAGAKKTGDILSSLKRIVSDDVSASPDVSDRLILSPEQRVTPPRKPAAPIPTLVLSNSLEAKVSQLEDIISRIDGTWEPDGAEEHNDYSGHVTSALPWDRVADAPKDHFDVVAPDTIMDTPIDPEPAEPVVPLNEVEMEAFRELVGKIVRDELKGSLGEKITTNIRKMVRREIALALKDMNIK
jgi:hypothetical protein